MTRVAFIGYGEAGSIFARDLAAAGAGAIVAYDIVFDPATPRCAPPAIGAASAAAAVADADLVISAVTAGAAVAAARSVSAALAPGTFFLDINSVSPATKRAAFDAISAGRGRYVEAAVMASVPPYGIRVPMLVGGPHAGAAAPVLAALGFNAVLRSGEIGVASAVKMCRSVVVKGLEALLTESLVTARRHGVEADVLASLAETFPGEDWAERSATMISRAVLHGRRRSEEMAEVARTVAEAGLTSDLGLAIAARQAWAHGKAPKGEKHLAALLDALAGRQEGAAR